jgi:enoyl-CoA hydratase/carnithine racemase
VTTPDDLVGRATEIAESLAQKDQTSLRLGKKLINSHLRPRMDAVMAAENEVIGQAVESFRNISARRKSKL